VLGSVDEFRIEGGRELGTVYMKEGLYEIAGDSVYLVGSECSGCGEKIFPARQVCPNCGREDMVRRRLAREGQIYTYTTIRQAAPHWKGPVPYTIVVVKLDDGAVVETHMAEPLPEKVEIGSRVELVLQKLYQKGENDLMVHKFKVKE